jgi:hypothetical protein
MADDCSATADLKAATTLGCWNCTALTPPMLMLDCTYTLLDSEGGAAQNTCNATTVTARAQHERERFDSRRSPTYRRT